MEFNGFTVHYSPGVARVLGEQDLQGLLTGFAKEFLEQCQLVGEDFTQPIAGEFPVVTPSGDTTIFFVYFTAGNSIEKVISVDQFYKPVLSKENEPRIDFMTEIEGWQAEQKFLERVAHPELN